MQSVSSRIWTRVAVSNSYSDNHYTTGTEVTLDRVLSMGQIELSCVLMLIWIAWNRTVLTFNPRIGRMNWVFATGRGDWGSIPGWVILKTQKWYLMQPCLTLSIIRYGLTEKWSNPGKGVAPSPTPRCSSNEKGSLQVFFYCGCQRYFYFTYAKLNCLK